MKTRKSLTGAIALALTILICGISVAADIKTKKADFVSAEQVATAHKKGYLIYGKTLTVTGILGKTHVRRPSGFALEHGWHYCPQFQYRSGILSPKTDPHSMTWKRRWNVTLHRKEKPEDTEEVILSQRELYIAAYLTDERKTYTGTICGISGVDDTILRINLTDVTISEPVDDPGKGTDYTDAENLIKQQPIFKSTEEAIEAFKKGQPVYNAQVTETGVIGYPHYKPRYLSIINKDKDTKTKCTIIGTSDLRYLTGKRITEASELHKLKVKATVTGTIESITGGWPYGKSVELNDGTIKVVK